MNQNAINPTALLAPFFTQRPNRIVADMPFAEYQAIPAVNNSVLKEPTAFEQLCKLSATMQLPPEYAALVEFEGFNAAEALELLDLITPVEVDTYFIKKARAEERSDKVTEGGMTILNMLDNGNVVPKSDVHPASLKSLINKGLVETFTRKAKVVPMTNEMKGNRAYNLTLGDAVHKAVLEPHFFDDTKQWGQYWMICPTKSLVSAEAIAMQQEAPHLRLITPEIMVTAMRSRDAVWRHQQAKMLLELPGRRELTMEVWDPEALVMRKARIDCLPNDLAAPQVELKTCRGVTENMMRSTTYQFGYHRQTAYYVDVESMATGRSPRETAQTVWVTKEAPFIARVSEVYGTIPERSFIEAGRNGYREALATFTQAYRENQWDAYENEGAFLLATK